MKKTLGIFALLVVVCLGTALFSDRFFSAYNLGNNIRWTSYFSIISIGVAFVIITGGIDLSIGSVIGLTGCILAYMLSETGASMPVALATCVGLSLTIGLIHGLLITKVRLQPFIVTLCGLLVYRGVARQVTSDQSLGFGNENYEWLRSLATGKVPLPFTDFELPFPVIIMIAVAIIAAVILNLTIYGRYLLALGRNDEAARYSGVNTDLTVIAAYVFCSLLAGLGGILFALDFNSVQPSSTGEFYELYAIAAAVLGGCSLRGGEGSITGVIIGAALLQVLRNSINILGIPTHMEFTIIGAVILAGVIVDEFAKRVVAHRRATAK